MKFENISPKIATSYVHWLITMAMNTDNIFSYCKQYTNLSAILMVGKV